MEQFKRFEDINVELMGHIGTPYETSVASARTCYSSKGIIRPEDVSKDERSAELRDRIASSTLLAGHLTTRQHAHFVFAITGVSRQCLWSFLHSHPYYNSEQVSQRYVRVKRGSFVVPPLEGQALNLYSETVDAQMAAYEKLIEVLKVPLSKDYFERFKARAKQPEKWDTSINKRAYEVARYALPVGTTAYLYHTVSALTLLRYSKLMHFFETADEQRILIQKMLDAVKAIDPLFEKELSDPLPLEGTLEYKLAQSFHEKNEPSAAFAEEFDKTLGGRFSKLVHYAEKSEEALAGAFRVAVGKSMSELSDDEALKLLLDPQNNPILADTLNLTPLDKLSQILHHVQFTFWKKISHTADSQDQRHRTVPASRPLLFFHHFQKPDYLTPYGITQSPEAEEIYHGVMKQSFDAVTALMNMGVKKEYAYYLLPNSLNIRMVQSGDLSALQHKWRLRSCYNAQEEIFRATIDEVEQVNAVFPRIGQHLKAPCYVRLRAGVKPYCPEGDRFCGIPVWKKENITEYQRKSL